MCSLSSFGIKEICTALADNAWLWAKPKQGSYKLRLDAICPGLRDQERATHGARYGKTEVQRKYHMDRSAWKRCCKKVTSQGEHITCIHDRFFRDPVYRESQFAIGWSKQKCKEWDEHVTEDRTYKLTPEGEEDTKDKGQSCLALNKAGKHGCMKFRSDKRGAVIIIINCWHHESGETTEGRIHPGQQRRIHQGQEVFSEDCLSSARVDQQRGWKYWPSSSSFSWWYVSEWLEVSSQFFLRFWVTVGIVLRWLRSSVTDSVWTEHRHDFLDAFILFHTSYCGSMCRTTCLHKTCPSTCHHMSERLLFLFLSFSSVSRAPSFSLTFTCSLSWTSTSMMSTTPTKKTKAHPRNEEHCSVAIYNPLTRKRVEL